MFATEGFVVEFAGGPLDGHRQSVSMARDELYDLILLPAGKVFSLLYGDPAYEVCNTLAIYELEPSMSSCPQYRYVGSIAGC